MAGFAPIHLHDPPGDPIEEIAVVGDKHQGPAKTLQKALQPLHPMGIEVVGGFIQQQHIGIGHQGSGQGHPLAIAPGEVAHPPLTIADAKPLQHFLALVLEIPGIQGVHAALQIAQLGQEGGIMGGVGHGLAEPQVLAHQRHFFATAGEHLLEHGALLIQRGFLVHQHHPVSRRTAAGPLTQGLYSGQHLEQGRFTRPVGADQAEPIPLADVQGEVRKQGADAEVFARTNQADQTQWVASCWALRWAKTLLSPTSAAAGMGNLRRHNTSMRAVSKPRIWRHRTGLSSPSQ